MFPRVRIETTLGSYVIELNGEKAPATALNFLQFTQDGYYDGTVFHRVLADSMIQGGGYLPDMEQRALKRAPMFVDNWRSDLLNKRGTIGLIRGTGPHTAAAEFYINVVDNIRLDEARRKGLYSVFGRVVDGMEVVDRIAGVRVGPHAKYVDGQSAVVPLEPVVIQRAQVVGVFNPLPLQQSMYAARADQELKARAMLEQIALASDRSVVTTESGLAYVDVIEGRGLTPALTDDIELNYEGKLVDGTIFETTFTEEPTMRQPGKLVRGLQETLTSMKEGGRRTVAIPPEMAFGTDGIPGHIPPDSFIIFDIELLAIR
jgi:cyclophilin family peptidyl-prolyl cis-trans isomerase